MNTQPVEGDPRPNPLGLSDAALSALLLDIFAQEELNLTNAPEKAPAFDPIQIRDLIRDAAANGKHPAQIVLGHKQAESYREFLMVEYGEAPPKNLKDSYFLGLQIVEENTANKLALVGSKPHDAWDAQLPPPWKDDHSPTSADQAA